MIILHRLLDILISNIRFPFGATGWERGHDHLGGNGRTGPHGEPRSQDRRPQPNIDPVLAGYYSNLEVPYGSDLITVKRAWKRLVRRYHPDRHSSDPEKQRVANELTQGLNRAYEELERRLK